MGRRLVALVALTLLSALGAINPAPANTTDHRAGSTPAHAWVALPALPATADTDRRIHRDTRPDDNNTPLVPLADPHAPMRLAGAPDDRAWALLATTSLAPRARAPPA